MSIDYPLIDCGFGVDTAKFPAGVHRGPFTNAIWHAIIEGHNNIFLSQLDSYIERNRVDRNLVKDYSDSDLLEQYREDINFHKILLRTEATEKGLRWTS